MPIGGSFVVYRCGALGVVKKKRKAHKGLESVGLSNERKIISEGVMKIFGEEHLKCTKVLSKAAKILIAQKIASGMYDKPKKGEGNEKEGEEEEEAEVYEPPYMAPSPEPSEYPDWCSTCNDFGEFLLLCAGCRVAVCSQTIDSTVGCLGWREEIYREDFVFYCTYCRSRKSRTGGVKVCEFIMLKTEPAIRDVYFRYDPPVLLIAATWHQEKHPFINVLHSILATRYFDSERLILRMDVSLTGIQNKTTASKGAKRVKQPLQEVQQFLSDHETAKIVVIVETHASDNGRFMWCGDDKDKNSYEACTLFEILRDCIPPPVFALLSNAPDAPNHKHKSLILNLACGATVMQAAPRYLLLEGHCAEAVLSLADRHNVSGEITLTMANFTARWIQSASRNLDVTVASTIPGNWAKVHKPVFSMPGRHILYTQHRRSEPNGELVLCPNRCNVGFDYCERPSNVRLTCRDCRLACRFPLKKADERTVLGSRGLVKVSYPRPYHKGLTWEPVQAGKRPMGPKGLLPPAAALSRSTSLTLSTPTSLPLSTSTSMASSSVLPSTPPPTPPPTHILLSSSAFPPNIRLIPPRPPQISFTNSDPPPSHHVDPKRVVSPELHHPSNKRQRK